MEYVLLAAFQLSNELVGVFLEIYLTNLTSNLLVLLLLVLPRSIIEELSGRPPNGTHEIVIIPLTSSDFY